MASFLAMAMIMATGCSSKAVTQDEFAGLTGRVDKLEQTVYRGSGQTAGSLATSPGPSGAYPPGGGVDPAFQAVFGPPSVSGAPSVQKTSASERSRYNRARSLLNQKKYAQAAAAFSEMLSDYPGGKLAPNARYWLGECRYAVGDYSGAFLEFRQGYNDYPQSNKAADCLLKMSYCQSLLGDGPGAMETLRILLANYPDSDSARLVTSGRGRFSGI
ncbi:MAG: tol-pal system protein YbgF [Deltaproteobacteria bacterium]|nr:tol-pal system protein YbgF [Deltaproteobacteria bacterium]